MNDTAPTESYSQNPSFRQLAFLVAIILIIGAWKFGLEGVMD